MTTMKRALQETMFTMPLLPNLLLMRIVIPIDIDCYYYHYRFLLLLLMLLLFLSLRLLGLCCRRCCLTTVLPPQPPLTLSATCARRPSRSWHRPSRAWGWHRHLTPWSADGSMPHENRDIVLRTLLLLESSAVSADMINSRNWNRMEKLLRY